MIQLLQGNCLKLLPEIKDKSVDLILCDLPYGTTDCAWDKKLNLKVLWAEYNRIIKDFIKNNVYANGIVNDHLFIRIRSWIIP